MPGTEERRLAEGVGRAIAKRRGACGLTQEQVAERLGIGVVAHAAYIREAVALLDQRPYDPYAR